MPPRLKTVASPFTNELLSALPMRDLNRLASKLHIMDLSAKQVLHQVDDEIRHVYFPTSSVVARTVTMEEGSSIEVGMAGSEGLTGICAFFGQATSPYREIVLFPGGAIRIDASFLIQEIKRGTALSEVLKQYVHDSFRMVSKSAACNQLHKVEQRCCRLLLMLHDRAHADEFPLTHETLALMLGVRRASVSEVAGQLQLEKFIRYRWGWVKVTDRRGIEERACRCYHHIKAKGHPFAAQSC